MPPCPRPLAARRALRLALARHRRLLSAGLLAAGVAAALQALAPAPDPTALVWTAARDLPAGHLLEAGDLAATPWPRAIVPTAALAPRPGTTLASPLRRGEPLTDARLLGPGLLREQPPGTLAAPVRLADPSVADLLRPGDRIDLVAGAPLGEQLVTAGAPEPGTLLSEDTLVLAVPGRAVPPAEHEGFDGGAEQGSGGPWSAAPEPSPGTGLVLLALPREDAHDISALNQAVSLTVSLRSRLQ